MSYAIMRTCKDDYFALQIMQCMLNKGMTIVSVTCDQSSDYCRYAVFGVWDDLGRNTTFESFCDELDKEIDKMYDEYDKERG